MMYKLKTKGKKLLKTIHLAAASCWVGGSIALGLPYFLKTTIDSREAVYGINILMHHIDVYLVIIPGAIGCFITGLIYSSYTEWGFFKYRWITIKWIITVSAITFGTFYLGPWIQKMIVLSSNQETFESYQYTSTQIKHFISGSVQAISLLFAVWLSVYKPWKKSVSK